MPLITCPSLVTTSVNAECNRPWGYSWYVCDDHIDAAVAAIEEADPTFWIDYGDIDDCPEPCGFPVPEFADGYVG